MMLLLAIAAVITGFLAICLLFFQATRKTYPGFGHWTAGVAIMAAGYCLLGLRDILPVWASIFGGNLAMPLGLLFQLNGIRLFFGSTPIRWSYFIVSTGLALALVIFYFVWDSIFWRGFCTSLPMVAIQWYMALLLFRQGASPRSTFIKAIGSFLILGGCLVLARIGWFALPWTSSQIWTAESEALFFVGFVTVHLGESFSMIMLNAERLEAELLDAQRDLSRSVKSLQEALTRQKQTEDSLRESEERYRNFFDTSRDAVFMTAIDGRFIDFNDVALEMLGDASSQRHELFQRRVHELYARPEERQTHAAIVARQGFSKEYPVELRRKDGTIIHTLITTVARKNSEGNIVGFQGTVRDITDRKKAEEALRHSEAKYRFLAEHASDVIWTLDLNLRTTFVTPSVEKVLGFSPEERMLQQIEEQLTPESLESARLRLAEELSIEREQGIQEGRSVLLELDYYHKNGSIVCLQSAVTFIRDENGTPIGLHGISRDVTDLKRAQEELAESEEKYRTVVEESFDGIYVHDGTVITFANSHLHEMLGYELGELQGLNYWVMFHPDSQDLARSRAQARLMGEAVIPRYEVILLRKDGISFPGEVNAKVIGFDEERQIQVWIRDLTEQKRLEKGLVEAQKMEAIGTLTGGIAHDFNNLLTIINGFSESILMEKTSDDPIYGDIQKILETGRKGADLVKRLLALSKKGESNPRPLDLNRTVENSVSVVKRTFPKMIEIETVLGRGLSLVHADSAQLDQILLNLCINAREAMPEGGKLRIETRNIVVHDADSKLQSNAKPGPHVLIEVTDTGRGMDAKTLDRLFDPFFTTKGWDFKKGTGLGLSVAKGMVEQHGGWITCESEQGKGTTFRVYLPAIVDAPAIQAPVTETLRGQGSGRILLVDDEVHVRELGKRILERAGYEVILASDGKEALEIYGREHTSIDLVVLDLIMPQMSGEKCLEKICKINPDVKVVVSSGHAPEAQEKLLLEARAKGFVNKPYEVKQLLRVVADIL